MVELEISKVNNFEITGGEQKKGLSFEPLDRFLNFKSLNRCKFCVLPIYGEGIHHPFMPTRGGGLKLLPVWSKSEGRGAVFGTSRGS